MKLKLLAFCLLLSVFVAALAQHALADAQDELDIVFKRTLDERTEPQIPKIEFQALASPKNLKGRAEALTYGILVYVPPEYDHYGYEIRRYMAHILNKAVFVNRNRLAQEIHNIKNAKIVLEYWKKHLDSEMAKIEAQIEERDASSSVRSAFNYNRGAAEAFLSEAYSWLDQNQKLLQFLADKNTAEYSFRNGQFRFLSDRDTREFKRLANMREEAHKIITDKYYQFRTMPY